MPRTGHKHWPHTEAVMHEVCETIKKVSALTFMGGASEIKGNQTPLFQYIMQGSVWAQAITRMPILSWFTQGPGASHAPRTAAANSWHAQAGARFNTAHQYQHVSGVAIYHAFLPCTQARLSEAVC